MITEGRLIFVGGKGGVGKSTTAATLALSHALKSPKHQVLLVSTDPAHSLSDSLEMFLDNEARPVPDVPNLWVRELSALELLGQFKKTHGHALKTLAERGTYFDQTDIQGFLDLSFPGVDEVMAILEISVLTQNTSYHRVVVDTAPTGHTLSLLRLPQVLERFVDVFELMQEKHHILQDHFAHHRKDDFVDQFVKGMREDLKRIQHVLNRPDYTQFVVVTLAEVLSFAETRRLISALHQQRIRVSQIVVNALIRNPHCPDCTLLFERQQKVLSALKDEFHHLGITEIPRFNTPVSGVPSLKKFASWLEGSPLEEMTPQRQAGPVSASCKPVSLSKIYRPSLQLWSIGGKGGVGKTTVSCALAVTLAQREPQRRYLLMSLDPASSLSDCLSQSIGDHPTPILKNLYAMSLDPEKLLQTFKREYEGALDDAFNQFLSSQHSGAGMDLGYDRKLFHSLMSLSPPGLDELMALYHVLSLMHPETTEPFDGIFFDASPTGHFLRFLEMPGLVRQWLNALFHLMIKYQAASRLNVLAQKLVTLSKQIREIQSLLMDAKKSCIVVVTHPEPMVVKETQRLVQSLQKMKLSLGLMVVNMLQTKEECPTCRSMGETQKRCVESLEKMVKGKPLYIPVISQGINGVEQLESLGNRMVA